MNIKGPMNISGAERKSLQENNAIVNMHDSRLREPDTLPATAAMQMKDTGMYISADKDNASCRVHKLYDSDLIECLMDKPACNWALSFGDARFCTHPSREEFVVSKSL